MPNQKNGFLKRIPLNSTDETAIFVNERNPINFTDTFSDINFHQTFFPDEDGNLFDDFLDPFFPDEDENFFFYDTDFVFNDDMLFLEDCNDNKFDYTPSYSENTVPSSTIDLLSYSKLYEKRHLSILKESYYSTFIKFKIFGRLQAYDIMEKINHNGFNIMKKNQNNVFKELKVHRNYVGHKIIDNNIINDTFYNFIRIQKICYYKVKRHEGKKKKAHAYYRNSFIHRYCLFL